MLATPRGPKETDRAIGGTRPAVVPFRTPARLREHQRQQVEAAATRHWLEKRERGPMATLVRRVARALWSRFNRLNAPIVYAWSPSRRGEDLVHQLHRMAADCVKGQTHGVAGRLWLMVKALGWLPLATAASLPVVLRTGPFVRDRHGQPLGQQWLDVIAAAWKHGIFPTEYYHHRVYRGGARADKARYLNEREVLTLLAAAREGSDTESVDNLFRFISECRAAGLAVPRTFAAFSGDSCELFTGSEPDSLPRKDLYFRPAAWTDGKAGAQIWRWNPQTARWSHRAESLAAGALIDRCRAFAAGRPHLLQECLRNHPDVERFSAGGLCSVRLATGLNEAGEPVPLFATLHLPACDAGGASTPAGDLHAGIEVTSGALQAAWGEFVSDGEFDAHPGTGAVIAGVVLPNWRNALELALRAHRRFRSIPFVAWEIGLSAAGAVLLEAGTDWGAFHHALAADTDFARLCRHHVRTALEAPGHPVGTEDAEVDARLKSRIADELINRR